MNLGMFYDLQKIVDSKTEISRVDFQLALDVGFALFLRRQPNEDEYRHYWEAVFQKSAR